jgi:hypothetical protein
MDDGERIVALMRELESDPAYARGDRSYEGEVSPDHVVLIAEQLLEAIDEGTAVRARKAEAAGVHIACGAGCHYCCEQPILVWLPEAMVVARFLERPENAAVKQGFLERYPGWRAAVGEGLERMADRSEAEDWEGYSRAHREAWQKRVVCAFNRDGLCTIYEARPAVCRHYHALDTAEHCRVDHPSGIAPRYATFVPLDRLVSRVKLLGSAMHHALGARRLRMVALCTAVHDLLAK